MKRWLRRLLYLLIIVVWLGVMIFPSVSFLLAMKGQLTLGSSPRNHLRLFMVQEDDTNGVGIEWTRPLLGQSDCAQTSITYLLWDGEGENTYYCQCYDPLTGNLLPADQQVCR